MRPADCRRSTGTRVLLALLALTLVTAAPGAVSETGRTTARAWAVWMHLPGQPPVELGVVEATSGAAPTAGATPVAVAGTAPVTARANGEATEVADSFGEWLDPTSSMSFSLGSAEARVDPTTAFGRTSVGATGASGFALADQLLTWEQQEQLLGTWAEVNTTLFDGVDQLLDPLRPLLEPRGLVLPPPEPMAALGFVDVAGAEDVASRAEGVTAPGFASASARTSVADVKVFGGFIELDGVVAEALAEESGGAATGRAAVTIGRIRIAGIEVELGDEGLVVASNGLLPREVVQPVLDGVLEQLDSAGIRVRTDDVREVAGVHEATAFEMEVLTLDGVATISIGHAEASARAVTPAPAESAPAPSAAPASPPSPPPAPAPGDPVDVAAAVPDPPAPPAVTAPPARAADAPTVAVAPQAAVQPLRLRPLGTRAARSVEFAYVLFVAGLMASVGLPLALIGRGRDVSRTRARPLLEER